MTDTNNTATADNLPALLPPEQRAALALKSTETELQLITLVQSSADITAVLDDDGREQAHRIAMVLRNTRTGIEKAGKAARDDATKFSKAVIAEEKRLIDLLTPEETRILALRDGYDAEQARIQAEKIAAERARTEAIEAKIAEIKAMPTKCVTMPANEIMAVIDCSDIAWVAAAGTWEEFEEQAVAAYDEAVAALRELYRVKLEAEEAAERERQEREADRQRIAAEQAELARVRAEQEAAARELARQQAAMRSQQEEMARMAREADAERQRQADAAAAELKRQADALAAERAEFERQRVAAKAAEELAADHAEALAMNAAWQPPAAAPELPPIATQEEAEAIYETAIATEEAQAPAELLDLPEDEPTDAEILLVYLEAFGGDEVQARERLARFGEVAA